MKKIYLLVFLIIAVQSVSAQFTFQNISLLSYFNDTNIVAEPQYGIRYQACWGWVDQLTGKEYGIIGSPTGTYIIEVTNPLVPVQRDYISHHHIQLVWHEYKTFGNYLYIISDGPANNSLQICDLSYLPDSVHVVYDSNLQLTRAHTISIDGNKMYLASVTNSSGFHSMQVYSITNPVAPALLRSLSQDYSAINTVHDMFVKNDTVYASCGTQGLYIFRYDSVQNKFFQLGSLTTYPDRGYNHSTVLSEDHSTLYMCEETEGKAVKVVDVDTIYAPRYETLFRSHVGAMAHNPYVKGDHLYVAYYQDGVYIYDISDPLVPVNTGYFDTHPQNGTDYLLHPFSGCWSVYTDLPSGTLLASDMQLGLFCLDASIATGVQHDKIEHSIPVVVYPNPVRDVLKIRSDNTNQSPIRIEMTDAMGRKVKELVGDIGAGRELKIPVNDIPEAMYYVRIISAANTFVKKVIVVR